MTDEKEKMAEISAMDEAALSANDPDTGTFDHSAGLTTLLEEISRKKVPVGSFARLMNLGAMQATIFMKYTGYWLRKGLAGKDRQEDILNQAHLEAALKLLATMGYMRGAVMKLGQAIAALPDVVPDEFAEILGSLHFEAPPMHYSMIREVFVAEMGCEPEEMFASFERCAFAAASLGQVHKARLKNGREVAVKIQYPHMGESIKADVKNLRLLLTPLRYSSDWGCLMDVLADVERILTLEADYRQEAWFCRKASDYFESQEGIVIPDVFDDYSSGRILTMEFLPGRHLKEYLAGNPSQEERNHYTELLSRFWGRLQYNAEWLVADPHPGNFIFMDNGKLGCIDFGCTRLPSTEEKRFLFEIDAAFSESDMARVDQAIAEACIYDDPAQMDPQQLDVLKRAVDWQFGPLISTGPFDWGDEEFFRRGLEINMDIVKKRCARTIPLCIWTNRMIYGFRAISYRLGGVVEFGDICREEKERAKK